VVNKRMAGDLGAIQAMQVGIHEHLNSAEPMRYIINSLKTLAENERACAGCACPRMRGVLQQGCAAGGAWRPSEVGP
jgi:hypothetical protein